MEEHERRVVNIQQEIEKQEMFTTLGDNPDEEPVSETEDHRFVTKGDVTDEANVVGHGAQVTHYRNAPDLATELEQLHELVRQDAGGQAQSAATAVTALEDELAAVKPDPVRVNALLDQLIQAGGAVSELAGRLRDTKAIETILYNLADTGQAAKTNPPAVTEPESERIVGKPAGNES